MLATHVLKKGAGIPIVFLHGFLGCAADWLPVVQHLHRTCIAVDLPGHGATSWTPVDISNLLSQALPASFHLVGYSLGGRIAMRLAHLFPKRLASLTLLSAHPGLVSQAERTERLLHDQKWAEKLRTIPFDEFLTAWYDQPIFSSLKNNPEWMQQRRKNQNRESLAHALIEWSLGFQPRFALPHAKILYGTLDQKFVTLFCDWPNAIAIPNAGHVLHLEAPKQVARHLP